MRAVVIDGYAKTRNRLAFWYMDLVAKRRATHHTRTRLDVGRPASLTTRRPYSSTISVKSLAAVARIHSSADIRGRPERGFRLEPDQMTRNREIDRGPSTAALGWPRLTRAAAAARVASTARD